MCIVIKGHTINTNKISKLGVCAFTVFFVWLLIVLISHFNLAVSAIDDDDSDSTLGQSDVGLNLTKHLNYVGVWGRAIFGYSVTAESELIPLLTIYTSAGIAIYKSPVLNIQLRGPPFDADSLVQS